ncbi:hypothetical protein Q7P37_008375 [Cladosporium fusiforme]
MVGLLSLPEEILTEASISLATQVCQHFLRWNVLEDESDVRFYVLETTCTPPVYYLIRQMVVAYHLPQLRPSMGDKFMAFWATGSCNSNGGALGTYAGMTNFMTTDMVDFLMQAHGILEPCSHADDNTDLQDITKEWAFASNVAWKFILADEWDDRPDDPFSEYWPGGGPIKEYCEHMVI